MKHRAPDLPYSRRQFVGTLAQGALLAGAAAWSTRSVSAAGTKNPFAYDVSRFATTDPQLIGWEEAGPRTRPAPDAKRLAIGPGDVLYLAAGEAVVRVQPGGATDRIAASGAVRCVAVAPDGTIYAGQRTHVEVFAANGERRTAWESPGPRTWFSGLAADDENIFAADAGNRVILRYDRSGKVVARIGRRNAEKNVPGLVVPSPFLDVRLHPDGLLRVNNPGRHCIEAYTYEGDLEGSWGTTSAAITGFCGCCNPIGLGVLADGRIVTCEKGLPRVKVLHADGTFQSVAAGTETFAAQVRASADDTTRGGLDVAIDSRGRIHVLDRVTAEIRILQPKAQA
jgi:hypothetical protein